MTSASHHEQATQTASASDATPLPGAPIDAPTTPWRFWLRAGGVATLTAAALALVINHVQTLSTERAPPVVDTHPAVTAPQPLPPVAATVEGRRVAVPVRPAAVQPTIALPTVLQVAGHPQALAGDRVALPSGARFDLLVTPPRTGQLEVYALSLDSAAPVLLWAGPASAYATVQTPMMRLEGNKGVERLRVLLRGDRGQVLGIRELRIWHV